MVLIMSHLEMTQPACVNDESGVGLVWQSVWSATGGTGWQECSLDWYEFKWRITKDSTH